MSRSSRLRRSAQESRFFQGLPPQVAVLAAMAFSVALGFGILVPVIPVFARTFGVSAVAASMVVSVFALVRLVTSPISGALVDRFGERLVLTTGLLIVAASSFAAGLSQSFTQLLVLRGAGGLGSSMFTVSAMALLIRVVEPQQRGRAVGAYQSGFLFGGIAGPAVGGLVVAWSIRAPFFVYAATLVVAALVTVIFLARTELREREAVVEGPQTGKREQLAEALRHRAYLVALFVSLVTGFLFYGMRSSAVPLFVTEGLDQTASMIGFGFLVTAGIQAILLMPGGRFADTRGRRPALVVGTTASTIAMLALAASDLAANQRLLAVGLGLFFLSSLVQGVSAAFLGSAPAAVVGDVIGGRRGGIVVSVFQMASDIGGVVGPLLVGLVIDAADFSTAFALSSVLSAGAVIVTALMPETLRRTAEGSHT